jgi:hypothetical protein
MMDSFHSLREVLHLFIMVLVCFLDKRYEPFQAERKEQTAVWGAPSTLGFIEGTVYRLNDQ